MPRPGLVLGVALVIAGRSTDPVMRELGGPGHPTTLAETSWLVASVGEPQPTAATLTLTFDGATLHGEGGCHAFGGRYAYDAVTGRSARSS